ncbi:hypothetical protein ATR1_017c0016 [Acetobacter tropicalis]|nr:hypothetical protein ATR1_017c0016 [Acetobacter tropicalis]
MVHGLRGGFFPSQFQAHEKTSERSAQIMPYGHEHAGPFFYRISNTRLHPVKGMRQAADFGWALNRDGSGGDIVSKRVCAGGNIPQGAANMPDAPEGKGQNDSEQQE